MPSDSNVGGLSGSVITLVHEDTQRLCYAISCGVWLNGVLEQSYWLGGSTVREACSQAFVSSPISVPDAYRSPRRHTTTLLRNFFCGVWRLRNVSVAMCTKWRRLGASRIATNKPTNAH